MCNNRKKLFPYLEDIEIDVTDQLGKLLHEEDQARRQSGKWRDLIDDNRKPYQFTGETPKGKVGWRKFNTI